MGRIGDVYQNSAEATFEWKIKDFSSLSNDEDVCYKSPKFYFCGTSWEMWLYPNGETKNQSSNDWIGVYVIKASTGNPLSIEYSLNLKTADGVKHKAVSATRIFQEKGHGWGCSKSKLKEDVIRKKCETTSLVTLTVICTLKNVECRPVAGSFVNTILDFILRPVFLLGITIAIVTIGYYIAPIILRIIIFCGVICGSSVNTILEFISSTVFLFGSTIAIIGTIGYYFSLIILRIIIIYGVICGLTRLEVDWFLTVFNSFFSSGSYASVSSESCRHDKILGDYKQLYLNQENCDVVLRVKGREFQVHKLILMARSPVFASTFRYDMREKETGIVDIEDCDPFSFSEFLCFLYSNEMDTFSEENVFGLFMAADKYDVVDLRTKCLEFMKENVCMDTFCEILTVALQHSETELLSLCIDFFVKNAEAIIETVKWQTFASENPIQSNDLFIKYVKSTKQSTYES